MSWGTIIYWATTNKFPLGTDVVGLPYTNKDLNMMHVPEEAYGLLFGLFFLW